MSDALPHHRESEIGSGSARGWVRRRVLVGGLVVSAAALAAANRFAGVGGATLSDWSAGDGSQEDWRAFKAGFIAPEGRVVDTGNQGVTHSEGQGYALLFAEYFNDRESFDRLLAWTRTNLRRPTDALHAWRYRPRASVPVDDINNATDGDLLIALALLRAGQRWSAPDYTDAGRAIGTDLLRLCVHEVDGARVLLPAAFGFEHTGRVVINPSYYVFPALAALSVAVPDPAWAALRADGLRILRQARFGHWRLPADWLQIANGSLANLAPAEGWPARFSWDAVRVPLHLAWAGLREEPALGAAADFWAAPRSLPGGGRVPAWADLETGSVATTPASRGVGAIAQVARAARGSLAVPDLPHVRNAEDYYSAALMLLSRVVWQETRANLIAAAG
jgi:endoglucanase